MTTEHVQPALRAGLIAIPKDAEELAATLHDLYAMGLKPDAISVIGKQEDTPHARAEAAKGLAARIESGPMHELVGTTLGAALGLLGGAAALTLPGVGPAILAGGAAAVVLEGLSATALGASLGAAVAAVLDIDAAARHEELFLRELEAGRWILLVTGTPDALRRAEIAISTHATVHTDRI